MDFLSTIQNRLLIFDGAFGTVLMERGLKPGENPTVLNMTMPEVVTDIHKNYLESGAQVVTLNTFSNSRYKIEGLPYSLDDMAHAAFECAIKAVEAAGKSAFLIYDIGPCGKLLEPMGEVTFEEAYDLYKEQAVVAEKYGADAILIETQSDLFEMKAGLLAAKENTSLPVICSITLEANGRTYTGGCLESIAATLERLGADAIGLNCSVGPKDLLPYAKQLLQLTSLPVIVQPNAGLPQEQDGVTVFDTTPDEFADIMAELAKAGANILGGCCGTNYEYIRKLTKAVEGMTPVKRTVEPVACACTPSVFVAVTADTEKVDLITPQNAEEIAGYIQSQDFDSLMDIALDKAYEGDAEYMLLDLTLLPGLSPDVAAAAIRFLQTTVRLPLGIAAHSEDAAKQAARFYNGTPYVIIK